MNWNMLDSPQVPVLSVGTRPYLKPFIIFYSDIFPIMKTLIYSRRMYILFLAV
jgi:hypothetical protein